MTRCIVQRCDGRIYIYIYIYVVWDGCGKLKADNPISGILLEMVQHGLVDACIETLMHVMHGIDSVEFRVEMWREFPIVCLHNTYKSLC